MSRCLAHVINLATQAVIKTYSTSKHYDPAKPEEHEPETQSVDDSGETVIRDEVGIIRAIAVKVIFRFRWLIFFAHILHRHALLLSESNFWRKFSSDLNLTHCSSWLIWLFAGHQHTWWFIVPTSCGRYGIWQPHHDWCWYHPSIWIHLYTRWLLLSRTLPNIARLIRCSLIQMNGSVSTTSLAFLRYELVTLLCICAHLPLLCSMLTMHNKLSHPRKNLLFTLAFWPLKLCTVHGPPDHCAWSMRRSA